MSGQKSGNGLPPKGTPVGNTSSLTREKVKEVHQGLMDSLWKMWSEQRVLHQPLDDGIFSRITVLSVTQMAAMTAVDVGLPEEQFIDICRENFLEAYRKAPKFG